MDLPAVSRVELLPARMLNEFVYPLFVQLCAFRAHVSAAPLKPPLRSV